MLENYRVGIETATRDYTEKQIKKLVIESIINLGDKLRDFEDTEVTQIMSDLSSRLLDFDFNDRASLKDYRYQVKKVKDLVKTKWNLNERGTIVSYYTALGVAFGPALGTTYAAFNPEQSGTAIAIGIPIGIAIGSAIGSSKEKKLDKEGKVY